MQYFLLLMQAISLNQLSCLFLSISLVAIYSLGIFFFFFFFFGGGAVGRGVGIATLTGIVLGMPKIVGIILD